MDIFRVLNLSLMTLLTVTEVRTDYIEVFHLSSYGRCMETTNFFIFINFFFYMFTQLTKRLINTSIPAINNSTLTIFKRFIPYLNSSNTIS